MLHQPEGLGEGSRFHQPADEVGALEIGEKHGGLQEGRRPGEHRRLSL